MGNVFQQEGNYPAAADAFKRAIDIDPGFARSFYCMGNLYREVNEQVEALNLYNKAIELDPTIADFYNNRGLLRYEMGDPVGAKENFQKAIELNPKEGLFLNNLGVLFQCLNQIERARDIFLQAIASDPSYGSSYHNLGITYSVLGDQAKALEYYDQALELIPDWPDVQNAKCISLLAMGQYEEGWRLQEWRWRTKYNPFPRGLPNGKLWMGEESLAGKTILIQSEQGLGDTLQFCRYLPLVSELGANIIFQTEKPLIELLYSLNVKMQMTTMDAPDPEVDYYCPILSLPFAFKTTLENIPSSSEPYLFSEPQKTAYWRKRIAEHSSGNKLRVGLVWAGAPRPQKLAFRGLNSRRDIHIKTLIPLLEKGLDDMEFYSLQKGAPAQAQLQELTPALHNKITDWTDELISFADTAALIDCLDVVVSVDTSTVHLAGAIGKPVFLLNRKDTCWRWLEHGSTSPWYPSLKVFRQSEMLKWDDVIENVITELRKLGYSKMNS
jgi:tetratricopeptide (TPR) repeat protein